jgi:IS4 transposase
MDVSREGKHYRLIASWPSDKEQPTYGITNLKRQQFSAVDITKLYRLRWQIELLFKEWKSWNNLRKFNTGKKEIMEGLIWSSLLSLLLKRSIAFSVSLIRKSRSIIVYCGKNYARLVLPIYGSYLGSGYRVNKIVLEKNNKIPREVR